MGLPTVFLVALLAAGGFWWTVHAPDRTGNMAARPSAAIERGCFLDVDVCGAPHDTLELLSQAPAGAVTRCTQDGPGGFVDAWVDDAGRRGIHWQVPFARDSFYALASPWVALWQGPASPSSDVRGAQAADGWALLPSGWDGSDLTVWTGLTGLDGDLKEGLTSLHVQPFGAKGDGTVRLAAYINGDEIVLEVPSSGQYELLRESEQLRFSETTTGPMACSVA